MKIAVKVSGSLILIIGVAMIVFCLFSAMIGVIMVATDPLVAELEEYLANHEYSVFEGFILQMTPVGFLLVVMGVHSFMAVFCVKRYSRIVERIEDNLLKILSRRGGVEA